MSMCFRWLAVVLVVVTPAVWAEEKKEVVVYQEAQDIGAAVEAASAFAQAAFLQSDYSAALALIQEDVRASIDIQKLKGIVEKAQPHGVPDSIKLIYYEPFTQMSKMAIYMRGFSGESIYYYRVVLTGSASTPYQVSGMAGYTQAPTQLPTMTLFPLPIEISKAKSQSAQ